MSQTDVVVVGGGVIGCSVAYHLAREGVTTRLVERDAIGAHASQVAAGMLVPSGESDRDAPFYRLARRSLARFAGLVEELASRSGIDPELRLSGLLCLATTPDEAETLRARGQALPGLAWLDPREVRELEPGLRRDVEGALHSRDEGQVRSDRLTAAFAGAARALGVRIETGVEATGLRIAGARVEGVETSAGFRGAARVVLCPGAWARRCGEWLGRPELLPVRPVRGQILALDAPSPPLSSIVWNGSAYLVPRRDGSLRVGATEEEAGYDARVTAAGVHRLLAAAIATAPALADCAVRGAWAGLRPTAPDRLPILGPWPDLEGVAVAAGHHRNGVLLSAVTGELLAAWVLGKDWDADAAAFRPDRFRDV